MNLDLFTFTYYYGNGDYYTGQGYAEAGTYGASQVLTGYANETGYEGSYTIDSVVDSGYDSGSGYNNYVYVTGYTDGDTGYGSAYYYTYGNGYSGLGSESGYAYNDYGYGESFSNSNEADLLSQYYTFTYYYGNGDSYSGYGYAAAGTYAVGQVLSGYTNETGYEGYYTIDSVGDTTKYLYSNNYVYVTGYYDGDTGYGSAYSVGGSGYSGFGSESGYAYNNSWYIDYFSSSNEADLLFQQYNYTYYYGNGDSYSGYVYAAIGTYAAGQVLSSYTNETGYEGYYTIDSLGGTTNQLYGYVAVSSYYDGDTGYGSVYYVGGSGSYGLGSESGYVYSNNYSSYDTFSNSNEADLINQYYTFTYTYGNGDSYSGYGYADQGTYVAGQVLSDYYNETGNYGYYTIDSASDGTYSGNNHYVYVNSYTDGDTGYGSAYYVSGNGYSGLGSESGSAYNYSWVADSFSNSNEADLFSEQYNFTYYYGNGDSYSGYGYAAQGTYAAGQVLGDYYNETGNYGYYTIDSVDDATTGYRNYVYVTSYTDSDTGYGLAGYVNSGTGYSGLGSEYGYAYDANGSSSDAYFTQYYEADILNQKYTFTYTYGNGDSYSGYGYALQGTYTAGQLLEGYYNETGNYGSYTIDTVDNATTGNNNYVYVTSYTDGDTGFDTTTSIGSPYWGGTGGLNGYYGLGSEYGWAYNANNSGDSYFSNYYEADLSGVVQVRLNLLADNGGTPGELISNNQIGVNHSFFVEILVGDLRGNAVGVNGLGLDFAWDGLILESINFDPALAITSNFPLLQDGSLDYDGLISNLSGGSLPEFELGQAIGINQLDRFALLHFYAESSSNGTSYLTTTVGNASLADDASYSLDVEIYQPLEVLTAYNQYYFTYSYGNGDSYTGYTYAAEGTYFAGQELSGYYNETGNYGSYTIDSISSSTFDSWYNNQIYVTSYYDGDTGYGYADILNSGTGYSGFGSEYGYAYDANGYSSDSYFSQYSEADILGNQLFNYTYYYGNGDSYSGYGYAAVGTYTADQTIGYYDNETGYSGYYTIDSVELGNTSTGYNGYVYITSYTDADTGYGTTTNLYNYGNPATYYGLGNEASYAYDSNGYSSDSYFNNYSEADILNQYYTFTYTYGNGDSYSGYGYALAGTYTADQVLGDYWNETGNYGSYTIDSVSAGTADSWYNNRVYVTSYTDGDTGYGTTTNLYSYGGGSGLGSEYGYAYDVNGYSSDSYFDYSNEADILGNQKFNYTYHYGNGDSYSGYGYAAVGTYTAGQTIGYYSNETTGSYPGGTGAVENNTLGYSFYGDSVYHLSYTFANLSDALTLNFIGSGLQDISDESWGLDNVKVTAGAFNYFNDFESDSVTGWSNSNRSTTPIGSRNFLGEFGNDTVSLALNDSALNGSVTVEFDLFILKSWDGNSYSFGSDYFTLTTSNGQTLLNTTFAKYPGQLQSYPDNVGYYTIDSVELGNTSTGYNGQIYVTSYTDGDTSYAYGTTTNLSAYTGYSGLGSEYGYAYTAEGTSYDSYFSNYYEADLVVPSISITDNSGNTSDGSIKFTTELSKFRKNYSDSDFVRPNYADSSKYFDITNTGTGVLSVSGIQINVTGVTTDLDFTGGDLLINPNESQRVKLTYDAAAAKESFNLSNGLVLFTNAVDIPEFAIALSGKSTFNSDINYNGIVNTGDLGALNQARVNYNKGILDPTADINGDGIINSLDISVLLSENKMSVLV